MKTKFIILFSLLSITTFGQDTLRKKDNLEINISGGIHVGFWALLGQTEVPYNLHFDVMVNDEFSVGFGITNDRYGKNPFFDARSGPSQRNNYRIRTLYYSRGIHTAFTPVFGASAGLSIWRVNNEGAPHNQPTVQLIGGFRTRINSCIYNQVEFALGPPYAAQCSFGITF